MIRMMCERCCWIRRLLSTRRLLGGEAAVPGLGTGKVGVGCYYPRVRMQGESLKWREGEELVCLPGAD